MKKEWLSKPLKKRLKYITQFPGFLIAFFLLGVLVSGLLRNQISLMVAFAGALAALLALLWSFKRWLAVPIVFSLGLVYFALFSFFISKPLPEGCGEVRVSSMIKESPGKWEFLVSNSKNQKAVVQTNRFENLKYGDILQLCFEEKSLKKLDKANKRNLLSKYVSETLIINPEFEKKAPGSGWLRSFYELARISSQKISLLMPGDSGALGKGLILGGSEGFSREFVANLRQSGTSHLVAVSGYNVSIITVTLFGLIRKLLSRRLAITSTIVIVCFFCLLTGASASVVRATVMGLVFVLSKAAGRRTNLLNSLLVAGFLMVLLNPFILWDIGFELSFAATFGMVFLAEPVINFVKRRDYLLAKDLIQILIETFSAQLFTLPILLGYFSGVSLVAPLANLLILPFVPLAMFLVFISLIAGLIWFKFALLLSGLTQVILDYFVFVINSFGRLSFSLIRIEEFGWEAAVIGYILLIAAALLVRNSLNRRILGGAGKI